MAVLSSVNVLYFRVALLCSIAYFCFKDVNSILDNSYFLVFTQAMDLPQLVLSRHSAQLGLFGVLFVLLAFTDLIPLLEDNKMYFYSIVPTRLLAYFIIATLAYAWQSNLFLHNNAVFIYAFVEIWLNFVIYNSLREEKEKHFRTEEGKRYLDEAIEEDDSLVATTVEIERTLTTETIEVEEQEQPEDSSASPQPHGKKNKKHGGKKKSAKK